MVCVSASTDDPVDADDAEVAKGERAPPIGPNMFEHFTLEGVVHDRLGVLLLGVDIYYLKQIDTGESDWIEQTHL